MEHTNVESNAPPLAGWRLAFLRWFKGDDAVVAAVAADERQIDWVRMLPFAALHLSCLGVLWVGWSPFAVGVAVVAYWVRMFAITGFYHRYFSHRTFKTSRPVQFLFAVLGNAAVQRGPLWWAGHHRHHHRHSDVASDVHSPTEHGFWWSHVLWITSRSNFPTRLYNVRDLARFPELRFLDRFDIIVPVLLAVAMYALGEFCGSRFPALETSGWQMLVWGFSISTIVLFHGTCTINSLSHLFGRRRFATQDHSRNNFWLALITMGEGWHNNHHYYPGRRGRVFTGGSSIQPITCSKCCLGSVWCAISGPCPSGCTTGPAASHETGAGAAHRRGGRRYFRLGSRLLAASRTLRHAV